MHLRDIVGLFPDHHNKARTAVKQVIIFFAGAVSCLQFVETHLWSPIKQSAIKWSMPIHGKLKLLLCCCTHLCLLLQKCKFSYNLMSFNRTLFLQDNFISRFSIIFVVFYQNTRKAGSHYQILLLYSDFNSVHNAKKVPSTSSQMGCWYRVTN